LFGVGGVGRFIGKLGFLLWNCVGARNGWALGYFQNKSKLYFLFIWRIFDLHGLLGNGPCPKEKFFPWVGLLFPKL
jgi:hypothetical protein